MSWRETSTTRPRKEKSAVPRQLLTHLQRYTEVENAPYCLKRKACALDTAHVLVWGEKWTKIPFYLLDNNAIQFGHLWIFVCSIWPVKNRVRIN